MNRQFALGRSCWPLLGFCTLVLMHGAWASDMYRCRDANGYLLLTDQPCTQQSMASDDAAAEPVAAVAEAAQLSGGRDEQAPAVEPKRSLWADLPHPMPRRAVKLDVATLQAARNSMLMADELHRQRKLASAR